MSVQKSPNEVRVPRQQRSRERVDAILAAARVLIVQKGSSGLKIQEIAKEAGVTAGSMYQYFPNKQAILKALAEQYFEQFHQLVVESLPESPADMQGGVDLLHSLLDQFLEMNLKDPVLRDIWLSISADKELRDMDLQSSQRSADLVFESLKHLFPESNWPNLRRYFLLVANITPSAIRLALSSSPEDCPQVIEVARKMISASLRDWAVESPAIESM